MNELNNMGIKEENNLLSNHQTKTIQKFVRGWLHRVKYHEMKKKVIFLGKSKNISKMLFRT